LPQHKFSTKHKRTKSTDQRTKKIGFHVKPRHCRAVWIAAKTLAKNYDIMLKSDQDFSSGKWKENQGKSRSRRSRKWIFWDHYITITSSLKRNWARTIRPISKGKAGSLLEGAKSLIKENQYK